MNAHDHPILRLASRIASPLPTFADWEAAGAERKTEIRRQWRNANTDEASRLCIRAGRVEAELRMAAHEAAQVAPEFTAKLSFDEQTALFRTDADKYWRYVDWVFGRNASMTARWAERENGNLFDRDKQLSGHEDYTSNPKQAAT